MYVRYSDSASGLSIDAKVWGPGAFGGSGMMTLYAGLGLSEAGDRAWRSGVRRTLGSDIAFGLEGTRSEPVNDDAPEHSLQFRAVLRW